jgi:uncharacterized protein YjbJ (UPF0337 family)
MAKHHRETIMNKDQVKGRVEEAKGKVKEIAGNVLEDPGMEAEGNIQKHIGKARAMFGALKEGIKKRVHST